MSGSMSVSDSRYILASKLAQFLRRNGYKIIDGSCKLSLTTSALCLLNSLFFDSFNPESQSRLDLFDSSISGIYEDVKFLYDFMERTSSLKLFHGMQTLRGGVDLSHFTNLTVLELRKIPAHLIIGLNSLSDQLKALICSRSIYLLKELFGSTADEQNTTDVWTELKELNLSYNYLESLDNSIKSVPNLEILDLSHNNLKNIEDIQALKRLSCVNLSYNQLELLPVFNSLSCRYMSKLYIRNNNLERLDGLECLFNLEEFDVGYNLLSEYSVLSPLDKLKSLKMINLEGNPLFFHNQHVRLVINYINPFAINRGLYLNGKFIAIPQNLSANSNNKEDESNTGRHQTSINTVVGDMQNVIRPPEIKPCSLKGASNFMNVISDRSSFEENSASSYTSQNSIEQAIATGAKPKRKHRKSKNKMRVAVINEPEAMNDDLPKAVTFDTDLKRQLVKEKFQARREERGESWLIPDYPFKTLSNDLQVNISESKSDANLTVSNEKPKENQLVNSERTVESQNSENDPSSPVNGEMEEVLDIQTVNTVESESERKRHVSKESDDIEILATNLNDFSNATDQLNAEDLSDCEFYEKSPFKCSSPNLNEEILQFESEEESEDSIFFVERLDETKRETIFVHIGAKSIIEKDTTSGKILDKLDLSSLSSLNSVFQEKEEAGSHEVHLEFDTVKTSRRRRIYGFEDMESAKRMCKILQPFADASTLKEATLGALECLNCKSQFSRLVADRKIVKTKKPLNSKGTMSSSFDESKGYLQEADACPNCGNHILVELETIPLPSVAAPPRPVDNNANTTHSPGGSSVGSSSSGHLFSNLFSSFKLSPAPKRKSVAGNYNENLGEISQKRSDAIGICQNEKEYSKSKGSESQMSRNSSGITIISNPSQSSIAVIPEPAMDSNLNTILERDSQLSLSPPISRASNILNNNVSFENDKDIKVQEQPNEVSEVSVAASPKDDPDFYSFTESFGVEKEKPFKSSDVLSSDSDVYHSPYRSVGSSNVQSTKKADDSDKLMQLLGEKATVTYDSFMHLDHRLKLHIEINIFGNDEHMNSCLQTSIVPLSVGEVFDGLFMLSSKNVYVIKFLAKYNQTLEQCNSLEKQIQVLYSGSLSQVKQIKVLLGNQGISVACGPPAHVYTLIIRDVDTCNTFSNLISEQFSEKNPNFECLTSPEEMLQTLYESVLTAESEGKPEILLHQFVFQRDKDIVLPMCVTLTKESLYLSKVLYKKQQSCTDLSRMQAYYLANSDHQKLLDVISLKLEENFTTVEICFLIESSDVESTSWSIEMQTKSAVFSFISALKTPWEELFAVPLPINMSKTSS